MNREPKAEPFRHERVERALLEELRSLISAEVRDPSLEHAWAVDVQLSQDGKNARVSYAVKLQGDESAVARETKEAFKRAAGFLRSRVAGTLDLKRTPQLSFVFIGLMPDAPAQS